MLGRRGRRGGAALSYRIPLWGTVLLAAALVYLDQDPMLLDTSQPEVRGEPFRRTRPSDVVLLIDYDAVAESPETFAERDWSAAWIDLLEQHVGPITVATPAALESRHLEQAQTVVLTASVADQIPESLVEKLRQRALDGLLLVVERPEGELREQFAANGDAALQRGREVTFAADLEGPYDEQLESMPVETEYVGSTEPREGAETLLAIDGAPVIYSVDVGEGQVVTVDFDLGRQLVALQQGRPNSNFRVVSEADDDSRDRPPRVDALVADEALRGTRVPYADLLERFVVYGAIHRHAPIVGLWPFPDDASGVVVPVHEDRSLGDGADWMLEYEDSRDATSTLLSTVDAGLTPSGAAVVERRGGEVGLLWRKSDTPARRMQRWGIAGFEPVGRPDTLDRQLDGLDERLPDGRIATTKTAGRWWDRQWARPHRLLAAREIPLDLSYEPRSAGFSFGTGFPTRVLDRNGMPLGLRELPIVLPSHSDDREGTKTLLESSRDGHHQVLARATRPESFGRYPDIGRFDQWVRSFQTIRRTGHVIRNARQLLGFWRGRLASHVDSRIVEGVAIPDSDDPATGIERDGDDVLLRISAQLERNDLTLTVPSSVEGRDFAVARRRADRAGGQLVAGNVETHAESVVGFDLRRIPLEAGSTRIDVYYASPSGKAGDASTSTDRQPTETP